MILNKQTMSDFYITFSAAFQEGLGKAEAQYEKIATTVPSTSASNQYNWLNDLPQMREWIGERHVKNVSGEKYTLNNKDYEVTISLNRNDVLDNTLNMFATTVRQMGFIAKTHPDKLVFEALKNGTVNLCYDDQPFFNANHPVGSGVVSNIDSAGGGDYWYLLDTRNIIKPIIFQKRSDYEFVAKTDITDDNVFNHKEYLYGVDARVAVGYSLWQLGFASNQALDATNYSAAKQAMRELRSESGDPLNVNPSLLVVSPSNEGAAKVLLQSSLIGNGIGGSETNIYYNDVELLVTPLIM